MESRVFWVSVFVCIIFVSNIICEAPPSGPKKKTYIAQEEDDTGLHVDDHHHDGTDKTITTEKKPIGQEKDNVKKDANTNPNKETKVPASQKPTQPNAEKVVEEKEAEAARASLHKQEEEQKKLRQEILERKKKQQEKTKLEEQKIKDEIKQKQFEIPKPAPQAQQAQPFKAESDTATAQNQHAQQPQAPKPTQPTPPPPPHHLAGEKESVDDIERKVSIEEQSKKLFSDARVKLGMDEYEKGIKLLYSLSFSVGENDEAEPKGDATEQVKSWKKANARMDEENVLSPKKIKGDGWGKGWDDGIDLADSGASPTMVMEAFSNILKASKASSPNHLALYTLARMFESGLVKMKSQDTDSQKKPARQPKKRPYSDLRVEDVEYGGDIDVRVRDLGRAFYYYNESATLGNSAAQRMVGFYLSTGKARTTNNNNDNIGISETDRALSILYYTFAARNYDVEAAHVLGYMYLYGHGVAKNCKMAARYYRLAAEQSVEDKIAGRISRSVSLNTEKLSEYYETGDMRSQEEELVQFYKYNAMQGDPNAAAVMGSMYMRGAHGLPRDYHQAKEWLERAVQNGQLNYQSSIPGMNGGADGAALTNIGSLYQNGLGVPQNNETARQYYIRAAELGNSQAQANLGYMYMNGEGGVAIDYIQALAYLKKAAAQMHAEAQVYLGVMHYNGMGLLQNLPTALHYFTLAAQQDNTIGQYHLAKMHMFGIGTPESCMNAVTLYKKVAEKGRWRKELERAFQLHVENGDDAGAVLLYERLAERGYEIAQSNAGYLYESGADLSTIVSNEDVKKYRALRYWRRAAEQLNSAAHLKVGHYYFDGNGGLSVDYEKAAAYYRYASDMRNAQATFYLGYMHQYGLGLPRDLWLAKRYYDLASSLDINGRLGVYLALVKWGIDVLVDETYVQQKLPDTTPFIGFNVFDTTSVLNHFEVKYDRETKTLSYGDVLIEWDTVLLGVLIIILGLILVFRLCFGGA